jgi:formylglycine-generating enzyme required for sulfatase activity
MDTTKNPDDLEAVRVIVAALTPFKQPDQERIIRWASEKVGLPTDTKPSGLSPAGAGGQPAAHPAAAPQHGVTIKHFVTQKNPKTDNQFAAVVAYYHRFEASGAERKDVITADDLQEACRKANRKRLKKPSQTLINAHQGGLLDKSGRGEFTINSVGENLVAMALPEPPEGSTKPTRRSRRNSRKPAKAKKPRAKK